MGNPRLVETNLGVYVYYIYQYRSNNNGIQRERVVRDGMVVFFFLCRNNRLVSELNEQTTQNLEEKYVRRHGC